MGAGSRLLSSGHDDDILRLGAFVGLHDFELHLLTFVKGAVTLSPDGAVVDKHVIATLAENESEPFRRIEPLHGSRQPIGHD